jgi:hypothetical protein
LVDDRTLTPKPNFWGAVLWRKLMGSTVLDAGVPVQHGLHVYAHCLRGTPGGVAMLVINTDPTTERTFSMPQAGERYTLAAGSSDLQVKTIQLNGQPLALGANDALPSLAGVPAASGNATFAPASISFLAFAQAGNAACR